MFMDSCQNYIHGEVDRLYQFLETHTQLKAADGGELVSDIYGNLPDVSWQTIIDTFINQQV
jgi:hypothetical protein